MSNWFGQGVAANNQTGDAAMRLRDRNGHQIQCIAAQSYNNNVNWDPVWSIQVTASRC